MGSPFAMKHRRNPIHGMSLALHSSLSTSSPNEMPSVSSLRDKAQKVGHLKKLSGKGILTAGTWRERFCLLVKTKLYFYESEESTGNEKSAGFVNLEYFDTCTEASTRMARKATNVFVIGSTEKGFFDTHSGRHYFAAETLSEMKEWVNAINVAMNHIRTKEKRGRDVSQNPSGQKKDGGKMKSKEDDGIGTLPRSTVRLDHITKGRAKGPPGRRLPRKVGQHKSLILGDLKNDPTMDLMDSDEDILRDSRGRATSLSALEASSETHPKSSNGTGDKSNRSHTSSKSSNSGNNSWSSASIELESMDASSASSDNQKSAYRYSSSSDSMEEDSRSVSNLFQSKFGQSPLLSVTGSFMRSHSRNGNPYRPAPVRHSSVTPPPCVLRKFRKEQLANNTKISKDDSSSASAAAFLAHLEQGQPKRTSSGSSLSTLTADTSGKGGSGEDSSFSRQNSSAFSSLQRCEHRRVSGVLDGISGSGGQRFPPKFSVRNSSSANASPLMNGNNGLSTTGRNSCHRGGNGYMSNFSDGLSPGLNSRNGLPPLERNVVCSIKKELESMSFETRQLDIDITSLRQDVGSVQENIATVRGVLDVTKERVGRLTNQVSSVERQLSSIVKETNVMREQAKKLLEAAEIAKATHENLVEEAEGMMGFFRQHPNNTYSCSCSRSHHRQHFQTNCCPSPLPSYTAYGPQQPPRRKGADRDTQVDSESDMELLDESQIMDSPPNRKAKTKSVQSTSSSESSHSNGTSVIDMLDHSKGIFAQNDYKTPNNAEGMAKE